MPPKRNRKSSKQQSFSQLPHLNINNIRKKKQSKNSKQFQTRLFIADKNIQIRSKQAKSQQQLMIEQKDKIVNKMLQLKAQRIKIQNQQNKIMKKISKLVKINQKYNNEQIYLNSSLQSQYIKYLINQEQQTSSNIIHNQQLEEDLTDIILLNCVTHTERMKDVEKQERQQIQANLNKENIKRKQQYALINQLDKIQKVQYFQNQRKNTEEQIENGCQQEEIIGKL